MSIISMIVGQLHVAASNREVCRYVRSKLNYGPRTSKKKKSGAMLEKNTIVKL